MTSLLETLEELFNTRDLYEVLGYAGEDKKSATPAQIKKSYHKSSLKYHPDRVSSKSDEEKELATMKFQALGAVYRVLSDTSSKDLYDESGEIADDDADGPLSDPNRDWTEYWRLLFRKVTLDDVKKFEDKYRGSSEEDDDLKAAYIEAEGHMQTIIDTVLCATHADEERFYDKLRAWVDQGALPAFKGFKKQMSKSEKAKRDKKAKAQATEAEELAKELGLGNGANSLANAIAKRQAAREQESDAFFEHLAAKYAKPAAAKKKKKN